MSAVSTCEWPMPSAWPISWMATVSMSMPLPLPTCHDCDEFSSMSPAELSPLYGGGRSVAASTLPDCGMAPMRMSPMPGSPCW